MNSEKREKHFVIIVFIIVASNFLCMFCFLILSILLGKEMEVEASMGSLLISFIIFPFIIVKKFYGTKVNELGIKKMDRADLFFMAVAGVIAMIFLYLKGDSVTFFAVVRQQLPVSIAEEFLMRGIFSYLLLHLIQKKSWVIIINGIIFGFFLHTGGDFISNLIYRFPAGIILTTLTLWSGSLYPAIAIHFIYNLGCLCFKEEIMKKITVLWGVQLGLGVVSGVVLLRIYESMDMLSVYGLLFLPVLIVVAVYSIFIKKQLIKRQKGIKLYIISSIFSVINVCVFIILNQIMRNSPEMCFAIVQNTRNIINDQYLIFKQGSNIMDCMMIFTMVFVAFWLIGRERKEKTNEQDE